MFLVDLSAGGPHGNLPVLPAPYLAKAVAFDWAALLEADPKRYKQAAAKQTRKLLQYLLSLRNTRATELAEYERKL